MIQRVQAYLAVGTGVLIRGVRVELSEWYWTLGGYPGSLDQVGSSAVAWTCL